jgi:hypothetical protein
MNNTPKNFARPTEKPKKWSANKGRPGRGKKMKNLDLEQVAKCVSRYVKCDIFYWKKSVIII